MMLRKKTIKVDLIFSITWLIVACAFAGIVHTCDITKTFKSIIFSLYYLGTSPDKAEPFILACTVIIPTICFLKVKKQLKVNSIDQRPFQIDYFVFFTLIMVLYAFAVLSFWPKVLGFGGFIFEFLLALIWISVIAVIFVHSPRFANKNFLRAVTLLQILLTLDLLSYIPKDAYYKTRTNPKTDYVENMLLEKFDLVVIILATCCALFIARIISSKPEFKINFLIILLNVLPVGIYIAILKYLPIPIYRG